MPVKTLSSLLNNFVVGVTGQTFEINMIPNGPKLGGKNKTKNTDNSKTKVKYIIYKMF